MDFKNIFIFIYKIIINFWININFYDIKIFFKYNIFLLSMEGLEC